MRIGYFELNGYEIDNYINDEYLYKLFGKVIIIEAVKIYDKIRYLARSNLFDDLEEGDKIPTYSFAFEYTNELLNWDGKTMIETDNIVNKLKISAIREN